jgi:hypothetical protein
LPGRKTHLKNKIKALFQSYTLTDTIWRGRKGGAVYLGIINIPSLATINNSILPIDVVAVDTGQLNGQPETMKAYNGRFTRKNRKICRPSKPEFELILDRGPGNYI